MALAATAILPGLIGARGLAEGQPVPELRAPELGGAVRTLADFPGRVTVLLFWQPDNPRSCQALCKIAELEGAYERGALATVVSGGHEKPEIEAALKACRSQAPVLLDAERKIFGDYQIVALPTLMLVGRDRLLKYKIAGFGLEGVGEIAARLDALYGRQKAVVAAPVGPPEAIRRYGLAQQLLKAGMKAQAESLLEAVTNSHPEFRPAWVRLGYLRIGGGREEEAATALRRALELDPQLRDVAAGLAWVCWKKGDSAGAAKWAAAADDKDPNYNLVREIRKGGDR